MCHLAFMFYIAVLGILAYLVSPWVLLLFLFTGFKCKSNDKGGTDGS